jgi:hypothetical protein
MGGRTVKAENPGKPLPLVDNFHGVYITPQGALKTVSPLGL